MNRPASAAIDPRRPSLTADEVARIRWAGWLLAVTLLTSWAGWVSLSTLNSGSRLDRAEQRIDSEYRQISADLKELKTDVRHLLERQP